MAKEKILVLSVDRDDDIGRKAGKKGPIIGRTSVVEAATAFGIADPEESDVNALFQAIRTYDELSQKHSCEVAFLTGHRDVGIKSDRILAEQLVTVLKKFPATGVVFVSDGKSDELVLPLIQSRVPIISIQRVIVKQSEQLETGYYKIKDFLKESVDNPKFSRLVFGLPAIVFILLSLFGTEGIRVVIGVLGLYLLIKGFKLEQYVYAAAEEVSSAFTRGRFAVSFLYLMSGVLILLGTFRGYLGALDVLDRSFFELLAGFVDRSIFLFFLSGALAWLGHSTRHRQHSYKKITSVIVFGFSISWVIYHSAELILRPEYSSINFIVAVVAGFILIFIALLMEYRS